MMLINSGQVRSFSFLHVSLYCFICPVVTDSMIYAAPVVEDRFVCSACQERNLQAIFSSKRALHNHMTKSKNPRCRSAGSEKIRVITRPGDVVAGGTGGMGPCPPPQHQPPGNKFFTLVYTRYIPNIYQVYTNVKVYTWYIPGI